MTNQPVSSTRLSYTVLNTWLFSWGQYFHDFAGDQLDCNNFYQRKIYPRVTVQEWINRRRPGNSNASKCSEGPRNEARSGCVFTPIFNTCILLLELIIHTLSTEHIFIHWCKSISCLPLVTTAEMNRGFTTAEKNRGFAFDWVEIEKILLYSSNITNLFCAVKEQSTYSPYWHSGAKTKGHNSD